jgi:cell division protease FtsH
MKKKSAKISPIKSSPKIGWPGLLVNAIDTPRSGISALRRRNVVSADIVAATVALKAALPAGLVETFGKDECTTLVIQVPTARWCGPVRRAFQRMLDDAASGKPSQEICELVRDGSERTHRAGVGDDEIVSAIMEGRSVLGISPDPARHLPRTLGTAPDLQVTVRPLDGIQMQEVIATVTGRKGRRPPTDEDVAGLDPTDVSMAIRPGSKLADCEQRLRKIAAKRSVQIGDDVPRLENLCGCDEARDWGLDLAKDFAAYREGRIGWNDVAEVGAIMVGEPGTGKTQLAKSLARTLGVPLIATSYAAWQSHREGHLGDLLSEMKRSATEARSHSWAVWFIDEVDSMPDRYNSELKYREWHVAVVNGLLELCERAARPGVILLGACNDASRMDVALMRPGRFGDRILKIPLCALGASGARVAEWVRGARRAARNDGRAVTLADLMLQISPAEDRSASDIRRAGIHEAGHCIALALTGQRVDFVSIRKSGTMGGQTTAPQLGTDFPTREDFERAISVLLAGRAAEEVLLGKPSASASGGPNSDLARATDLVVGMHAAYGLGNALVVHVHGRRAASDMLRADAGLRRAIDENMSEIYKRTVKLISENSRAVTLIADRLVAVRHLVWADIRKLLDLPATPAVHSESIVPALPASGALPPSQFKRNVT